MEKTSFLMLAFVAMLCVGFYSCTKDNDGDNTTTKNGNWIDMGLPSGLLGRLQCGCI